MKNKLFKISCIILLIVLLIPAIVACTPRTEVLKVYNWAEYINPDRDVDILGQFERYYKQITGKNIKVKYKTFDTNETLLLKVDGKVDYDVICPSDYIIEKLVNHDLLIELEKDLGKDVNGVAIEDYRNMVSDFTLDLATFDPDNKYCRPYTWGTMGILYNPEMLRPEDRVDANNNGHPDFVESWDALWSEKYKNLIYMKDSIRDTFAIGAIYTFANEIRSGKMTISEALNATDSDSIKKVEANLIKQKEILLGYEVDYGKQDAIDGKVAMTLQWGGDALWAISEAAALENPVELKYIVPEPGSNKFFDGWCIPKYSSNPDAAQLFINFMCRPDISIANMDYIWYSSPCNTQEFIDYMNDTFAEDYEPIDISYFLGEGAPLVPAPESMYPPIDVINRCAVMKDYGDAYSEMVKMWINVKTA